MKFILFLLQLVFCLLLTLLFIIPIFYLFYPIFISTSFVIPYAIYPFDICLKAPIAWKYIKITYYFTTFYVCFIISNSFFHKLFKGKIKITHKEKTPHLNNQIYLLLGLNESNNIVYLTENGLFQNILITGTIGSGKTTSGMYPFCKQLISNNQKLGMLILDVKGNFYKQILHYAIESGRSADLCVIEVGGSIKYNPLDKPFLKPSVLANRLKTILTLFSPNNSESYWLDKAEQVLAECIKLCRLYNNNYVTFTELHKLVNFPNYYNEKISILRNLFKSRQS